VDHHSPLKTRDFEKTLADPLSTVKKAGQLKHNSNNLLLGAIQIIRDTLGGVTRCHLAFFKLGL